MMLLRIDVKKFRNDFKLQICTLVLLLGIVAFSCCIAAEFNKVEDKDMKLDGSLCSLPRKSAFGLGISVLVCISAAQIIGTSAVATSLCSRQNAETKNGAVSITLLILSWVFYGLAAVILATASSMNSGQSYGKGWMNGECYIVHDGVYAIGAALVIVIVTLLLGFIFTTGITTSQQHTVLENLPGTNISKDYTNNYKDNKIEAFMEEKDVGLDGL